MSSNFYLPLVFALLFVTACSSSNSNEEPANASSSVSADGSPNAMSTGLDDAGTAQSSNSATVTTANASDTRPVALDEIRGELFKALAGYQSEKLATDVGMLADMVTESGTPSELPGSVIADAAVTITDKTKRLRYDCNGGGTLTKESASRNEDLGGGSFEQRFIENYVFDQCVINTEMAVDNELPQGEYKLTGSFLSDGFGRGGVRGFASGFDSTWISFNLVYPKLTLHELDGTVNLTHTDNSALEAQSRQTKIAYYRVSEQGEFVTQISEVSFEQSSSNAFGTGSRVLGIDGTYEGPLSAGAQLSVSSEPAFMEVTTDDISDEQSQPLAGQILIRSTDGSELTMRGNGVAAAAMSEQPLVLVTYVAADGTTTQSGVPLLDEFAYRAPGCIRDGQQPWPGFEPCN